MPLTAEQLEGTVREHIRAESAFDLAALRDTLHDHVAYELKVPRYPDDPEPYGCFEGADVYLDMWRYLHEVFSSYDIDLEGVTVNPERGLVWVQIKATAVPVQEWHGLPAGKPLQWFAAAACTFDDDALMTRETVYGSFPPTLLGYLRMREFLSQAGPRADRTSWDLASPLHRNR